MKKRIIIISSLIILSIVIVGIYSTFATEEASTSNNTYDFILSDNNNEIRVPASSSKTVIYKVTNTNRGKVKYGVVYLGENISVKVYEDSPDEITGYIDYGETKFIKLYIENNSESDSTVTIKTALGYEAGGELEGTPAVPNGYNLVNEIYIENLVRYINNLYNTSTKTVVTNNNIDYNYAISVSLMNDRLGGTTQSLDDGNIRYYGENPNNYVDIGDYYIEDTIINNMDKNSLIMNVAGVNDETSCRAFFNCDTNYTNMGNILGLTLENTNECKKLFDYKKLDQMCGTETKKAGEPILYRIIGLFKNVELASGQKKDLIKLVREDSIGFFSYDMTTDNFTTAEWDNEWQDSTLNNMLNNAYLKNIPNFTHYYGNSLTGNIDTSNVDFTQNGIKEIENKIESVIWNLGGYYNAGIYSDQIYQFERGSGKCYDCTYETTWKGKVAVAYPSDHGYGVDLSLCNKTIGNYYQCNSENWISSVYNGALYEWLLTPYSSVSTASWIIARGVIDGGTVNSGMGVRPTFFLDDSINIESGEGTETNPYVLR